MGPSPDNKRIYIDLNHPADFHLFRGLIGDLEGQGWKVRISARDKDCLHDLLKAAGMPFLPRGKGSPSMAGKYLYGIWLLLLTSWRLLVFRPRLTLSLSSPYLILGSWLMNIPSICYDDNDLNPRLRYFQAKASVIVSPAGYRHKLHSRHFHVPVLKELVYIKDSGETVPGEGHSGEGHFGERHSGEGHSGEGAFIRITRTDTVHHSRESVLDMEVLNDRFGEMARRQRLWLSAEEGSGFLNSSGMEVVEPLLAHRRMNGCRVFWGNSTTMASEAALLGLPVIYVSAELNSCLLELAGAGLLEHYLPAELEASLDRLEACMAAPDVPPTASPHAPPPDAEREERLRSFIAGKSDLKALLMELIRSYPELPGALKG